MKETAFNHKFNEFMRKKWPYMWHMKVHGHEMQQSGIADDLYCINGAFVAIEFKIQRDGKISTTPMQISQLNKVKNASGVSLLIAREENSGKILILKRRIAWQSIKRSIKIDWDFEFSKYETAIDLIDVMIGGDA